MIKLAALLEWSEKKKHPSFEERRKEFPLLKQAKLKLIWNREGQEKQLLELKVILTQNKSV